ncbi:MAG: hypothetical protein IPL54_09840 [Chitinophagaceae bacterium]|nr:hypothetical protein [Chitinophagaceae bacterium]
MKTRLKKNLSYLIMQKHTGLTVEIHPILHAYMTKGIFFKTEQNGAVNTGSGLN